MSSRDHEISLGHDFGSLDRADKNETYGSMLLCCDGTSAPV